MSRGKAGCPLRIIRARFRDPPRATAAHNLETVGIERISTGKFNDSFFAHLADGRDVVLHVAPPDDAGFLFYERRMMAQEPALHRLLRSATAIPVAEILAYDELAEAHRPRLPDHGAAARARDVGSPALAGCGREGT